MTTDAPERLLPRRRYSREVVVSYVVATAAVIPVYGLSLVGTIFAVVFTFWFGTTGHGWPYLPIFVTVWLFLPAATFFAIAIPWNVRISRRYDRGRRSLWWAAAFWALVWVAHLVVVTATTAS